jgi:hypothetical protein
LLDYARNAPAAGIVAYDAPVAGRVVEIDGQD